MKIRGITVGTSLKPEKNLVKATDLTPEEKALARANIGAAVDCGLEQPVWGKGDVEYTKGLEKWYSMDGELILEMEQTEYDALIDSGAKLYSVVVISEDNYEYTEIPWDATVYGTYDVEGSEIPINGFAVVSGEDGTADFFVKAKRKGISQIPGEYTGLGDVASALDHIIALQEAVIV